MTLPGQTGSYSTQMIDFKKTLSETDRYNFHSHTQFCDGRATMEQFVEAAAEAGFAHWGFTPHSPIPIASSCNMEASRVDEYIAEADRLKALCAERHPGLTLHTGMEIDYLGPDWGPAHPYFRALPLDFRIGSVHFISNGEQLVDIDGRADNFKVKMAKYFDNDIKTVVDRYFTAVREMILAGGFDILGHYDKIAHNADHFCPGFSGTAFYRERVEDITDLIVSRGLTTEINTKARADHRRFFPAPHHWKRLKEAGIALPVNSDAHFTALVDAGRSEALEMLRRL